MKTPTHSAFAIVIILIITLFSPPLQAASQIGIASIYSGEKTANGEYAHAADARHRPAVEFLRAADVEISRQAFVGGCGSHDE